MNKKKYSQPETESLVMRLELNFMDSLTGNVSGQDLNKSELAGDFDDYFN